MSEHRVRVEQAIEATGRPVAGSDPNRQWPTRAAPPDPEVPDLVAVWSLHHGGVADGARDRTVNGARYSFRADPSDDRCVLLTNGRALPGHRRNGGALTRQGVITLWCLHIWGIATHGSIVVPPAGAGRAARLSTLRRFADHAVARHATDWWTPAVVAYPGTRPRLGIRFADRGCAREAATEVDATRLVVIDAPAYADPTADDANVDVEELDGDLIGVALLLPSVEHIPGSPRRLAALRPTKPNWLYAFEWGAWHDRMRRGRGRAGQSMPPVWSSTRSR